MEKNDTGEWQNCPEHGTSGKQHFVLPLQPLSGELFTITLYRKQTQQGHTGAAGPGVGHTSLQGAALHHQGAAPSCQAGLALWALELP